MHEDFTHTVLGRTGIPVHRLGLSATYRPGKMTIHRALDEGVNFFFCFGFDGQMVAVLREALRQRRSDCVVATGPYNLILGHTDVRRTLKKRLRQLHTEYIDVFLFLGVTRRKEFPPRVIEEMIRMREEGKVRAIGLSTHDRQLAGELAAAGDLDVLMIRYNAAHRGAEQDIFPYLERHNPGVISYTATRWRYLIRRMKGWPKDGRIPTAGECYRFVLTHPLVDVCLTAPTSLAQFEENLAAVRAGPLSDDELVFLHSYGDAVHNARRWFM